MIYDTEAADLTADYCFGSPSDFEYEEESLYLTEKGNWFLHGEGGAKSKYSRRTGRNEWSGGSAIVPLTLEDAQRWLEEHKETRALLCHFASNLEIA
jgi:hypothetical protein